MGKADFLRMLRSRLAGESRNVFEWRTSSEWGPSPLHPMIDFLESLLGGNDRLAVQLPVLFEEHALPRSDVVAASARPLR